MGEDGETEKYLNYFGSNFPRVGTKLFVALEMGSGSGSDTEDGKTSNKFAKHSDVK